MTEYNFYPFNHHGLMLQEDNKVVLKTDRGHLCGYVLFLKKEIPRKWWGNYDVDGLQYLNIHGGLTYAKVFKNKYVVFGFDCNHVGDSERSELFDPHFVMELTKQMERQLLLYAKKIKQWRQKGLKGRLKMLDEIRAIEPPQKQPGLGLMIEMLSGARGIKPQ